MATKQIKKTVKKLEHGVERVAYYFGTAPSLLLHLMVVAFAFSLPLWTSLDWNTDLLAVTTILSVEALVFAILNQNITNKNFDS